jgi:lysozyme
MSFLEKAKKMLIKDEGLRHKLYKCPAGKLTIGVGRNIEDRGVSDETISQMLQEDIGLCLEVAYKIFGAEFNQFSENRQLGIINMIFNLGELRFSKFTNTIAAMKLNNWSEAVKNAKNSLWYQQIGERGNRVLELLEHDSFKAYD